MENITSIFQVFKMELKHLLQGKTNLFLSEKYNKVQTESATTHQYMGI